MKGQHWQPWLIVGVGLWLIASPYVLGVPFADEADAGVFRWSFVGPGCVVLLLAITALGTHQSWETGLAGAAGLWVMASPWLVGFADAPASLLSAVGAGLAIVSLGIWSAMGDRWHRTR